MTLNLSKQANSQSTTQISQNFMQKHNITVNEPTQTHFSVEGVQAYSPDQIKAMKSRAERVNAQKEGTFIQPTAYQIDEDIVYDTPTPTEQMVATLRPKTATKKKEEVAEIVVKRKAVKASVKPSVKNELGRANQQLVKLAKHIDKKEQLEAKMQELTKKYKQHFGEEIKANMKKQKAKPIKDEAQSEKHQKEDSKRDEPNEGFQYEQQDGEQALPQQKEKSIVTCPKTKAPNQDDSFEEVEWENPTPINSSRSNMKASTYSEKLGNAVHFLFD